MLFLNQNQLMKLIKSSIEDPTPEPVEEPKSVVSTQLIDCDITKIQNQLQKFASERDWEQFHTPKNLSMALSVEASELVEIFQWLSPEESSHPDQKQTQSIQSEVADIAMYLIRICQILEIDLESAIQEKIIQNENKYPVELSKGNARKYNQRDK